VKIRLCISILPATIPEALRLIEKAEDSEADFIEVRIDQLGNSRELSDVAAHGKTPKIVTYRLPSRQGKFSGTSTEQNDILLNAAKSGFEYIDVDLSNPNLKGIIEELGSLGVKSIVSFHDFTRPLTLSEMNKVLEREISSGAGVCKIVTTAKRVEDNLVMLNFASAASGKTKLVCFCMGELGKISRLLAPVFGSFFTFASLERGSETAAGQMTVQEMKAAYELLGLK
jgi:3-dehydroquinate dehydratase type I